MVDEAESILVDRTRSLDEFGKLLDEGWKLKRSINNVISTDNIDLMYCMAKKAGALGGKLLGAGGGGFMLFYVRKEQQQAVKQELKKFLQVPFEFEERGTDVIYYNPEVFILED